MPRTSGEQMVKNRVGVLEMIRLDPRPSNVAIAKALKISESTVRYIIKKFQDRDDDQILKQRNDKPKKQIGPTKRWKR